MYYLLPEHAWHVLVYFYDSSCCKPIKIGLKNLFNACYFVCRFSAVTYLASLGRLWTTEVLNIHQLKTVDDLLDRNIDVFTMGTKEEYVAELPIYEGKIAENFPDVGFSPLFFVQSSLLLI